MTSHWKLSPPLLCADTQLLVIEEYSLEARSGVYGYAMQAQKVPVAVLICQQRQCRCVTVEGTSIEPEECAPYVEGMQAWLATYTRQH